MGVTLDSATAWAEPNTPDVDYKSLKVAAKIKRPPGAAKLYPAEKHPGGLWKFSIPDSRGSVDFAVDITGNLLNKKEFKLRSDVVSFRLPVGERLIVHLDSSGAKQIPAAIPIEPLKLDEADIGELTPLAPPSAQGLDAEPVVEVPVENLAAMPFWAACRSLRSTCYWVSHCGFC